MGAALRLPLVVALVVAIAALRDAVFAAPGADSGGLQQCSILT
jgi:hypothetical protein